MNNHPHTPPSSSLLPRKRIACSQLRAGMYLVRILDSWWRSPFFIHRRLLRPQDVQLLVKSGIREVEIDTTKGMDIIQDTERVDHEDPSALTGQGMSSGLGNHTCSRLQIRTFSDRPLHERETYEQLSQFRENAIVALERLFEGAKTGQPIPVHALHSMARELFQNALAHPALLAEVMLIEQLECLQKTLYSHVVDTAALSILLGLQLEWDVTLVEEVAVAALIHDVGYLRLPHNLVHARWGAAGNDRFVLRQHVEMGLALIQKTSQFSQDIVQMIREHHAYQDGSGYPEMPGGHSLSASGKLLGLVDYFDELVAEGHATRSFPAALVIRRMYQESQKGKFPTIFMEAMIRVLGVYPVGTFVALSTGETGMVVQQNPKVSVKPRVKILRASDGQILQEPELKDLAISGKKEDEVKIVKILQPAEDSNVEKTFS